MAEFQDAKLKMHIKICLVAANALLRLGSAKGSTLLVDFINQAKDVIYPYLDNLHGATLDNQDHNIFLAVARQYEKQYFDDMHSLNVLDPEIITRATEFIPQMVAFIQRIIANGFAFSTDDESVYFDIAAFAKAGHRYSILEPWNRNNTVLRADGKGALANKTAVKRNDADFAL